MCGCVNKKKSHHNNLLDVAGATLLRISLIIYNGSELTATMTATFHANLTEVTNARSGGQWVRTVAKVSKHLYLPKYSGKNTILIA